MMIYRREALVEGQQLCLQDLFKETKEVCKRLLLTSNFGID